MRSFYKDMKHHLVKRIVVSHYLMTLIKHQFLPTAVKSHIIVRILFS